MDETAFNDPADDPEEEEDSSNDDTTSNDGTEAPAPAPPTEESSQPAEGISNDFLAQMELQQAEMAKAIEQQLDEIATSGQLQESLKETFGDDVSYMSLSTKVEEPAAGPSTSEDEQTESSSTKNIIVGAGGAERRRRVFGRRCSRMADLGGGGCGRPLLCRGLPLRR